MVPTLPTVPRCASAANFAVPYSTTPIGWAQRPGAPLHHAPWGVDPRAGSV